jgi:hypothetical protein
MPKFFVFIFINICCQAQTLNYYFGNLHAHTSYSDGNRDSLSSSISGPAESYAYAKLSNDFDFLGISEHNHYSTVKNPGFKKPLYQRGRRIADSLNQENQFLCLFGMEYGVSSNNNGHVLIYNYDSLIGWESNVGGQTGPNYEVFNGRSDYGALFRKIARKPGAYCFLAHPYWTDFTTLGTDSSAIAYAPYDAGFDSAIVGMPLRSGNAFSVFDDYSDYSPLNYFNYYKKLLHQGYHLGIGYDHDNHYSNFGRSNGGRLATLMPSLTRSNFNAAIRGMHFYGSDDANAKLEFSMYQHIMGDQVLDNRYPFINVKHSDPDGEQADTIRIWKGYTTSAAWAFTVQTVTNTDVTTYYDLSIVPGREYFYFVELRQKDGQWMVSSPIWYRATASLSVNKVALLEHTQVNWQSESGLLQVACPTKFEMNLRDVNGQSLLHKELDGSETTWNLNELPKGIYVLDIRTDEGSLIKKLYR